MEFEVVYFLKKFKICFHEIRIYEAMKEDLFLARLKQLAWQDYANQQKFYFLNLKLFDFFQYF
jgi:uncharacterized protein YqfB (UPF0267 family)